MQIALHISQLLIAIVLILTILIQEKGVGLGEGISGSSGGSFQTSKRGAEKFLSQATVVLLVLFLGLSLLLNFI